MSINQIVLTPEIIAELFKESLVGNKEILSAGPKKTESNSSQIQTKFLGKHKSKILVLVHEPQAVFLQDTQLAYLTRILNACRLTMEDIALINSATLQDFNYRALQQEFPSNFVLLFGVTPSQLQLPIDFPLYQLQKLERTTFLQAPTLEQIEPSKSDREKLWQSLKKYFDV